MHFIPTPKHLDLVDGACRLGGQPTLAAADPALIPSLRHFAAMVAEATAAELTLVAPGAPAGICILPYDDALPEAGYRLEVDETVRIAARDARGAFHGLMTLLQAIRQTGLTLPRLRIADHPDLALRGYYYDVSRGRIPTLDTLKLLARTAAGYKLNQLQLYVEHTFAFPAIPELGFAGDALTAADIIELDRYCRELHVELVPSLATFGHMHGILSLPRFRHLREIAEPQPLAWLHPGSLGHLWMDRMRHHTIDVANPESRQLLGRMFDEFLPLFSSPLVNVCGDETFDLGKGRNRALAEQHGSGKLYLGHILWLHQQVARHGRRMMMWGDIVLNHPELLPQLPRDITVLNWNYGRTVDAAPTQHFAAAGLAQVVCSGIISWGSFLPVIAHAEANIACFAALGKAHGALGILNTDWGDWGHVAPLAGSWYGLAYGAACGWGGTPDPEGFAAALSSLQWGDASGRTVAILRACSALPANDWNQFNYHADNIIESSSRGLIRDCLQEQPLLDAIAQAEAAADALEALAASSRQQLDYREFIWCVRAIAMNAHRFLVILARKEGRPELAERHRPLCKALAAALAPECRRLWRRRCSESEVGNIIKALACAHDDIDQI